MRYWALIGSTSRVTPEFCTQKSPSSTFSSNVKPYWKPEQPPPDTKTRSFRFGFASSRISSPTLPAAASVKTSTWGGGGRISVSLDMSVVVLMWIVYSLCILRGAHTPSKRGPSRSCSILGLRQRLALRCGRRRPARASMDQLTINLGAHRRFNDPVLNVAEHPGSCAELDAATRLDVTLHETVQIHAAGDHGALDAARLAHREDRIIGGLARHVAVDVAVEVQAARKLDVALDARARPDERLDVGVLTRFPLEHSLPPANRSPPALRSRPTFLALSRRRLGETRVPGCAPRAARRRPASARSRAAARSARRNPRSSETSMPGSPDDGARPAR